MEYIRASLQNTEATVLYNVRAAYVAFLISGENIKLLEKIYSQRKENSSLIKLRYESGREDKGNLLSTKADEGQSSFDLSSAKRDHALARLKLSQLIASDIPTLDAISVNESPESPDFQKLLSASPAFLLAKYTLESAELADQSKISEFLPEIALGASYRKSGSGWPPDDRSSSVSLSLSYSLFPGGSNFAVLRFLL